MSSHLADTTSRNVVVGRRHHKDGLGIAHACFYEFDIGNTPGKDLYTLAVDDFGNQPVQFGDIAAISIDFVIGEFEEILD